MGYYFKEAKTAAEHLCPEQNERYKALRSGETELQPTLKMRFEAIKKRIGPLTSGEILSAFEELWQDAVVCWIIFGENPEIAWIDLHTEKKDPTKEGCQRTDEWWDNFFRKWKEEEDNWKRQCEKWEREMHPIRTFFRDLFRNFP